MRLIFISLLISLLSCGKKEISDMTLLNFGQLPTVVQDVIQNRNKYERFFIEGDENIVNLDSLNTYTFETKNSGPWTDFFVLKNKTKGMTYQIPYGKTFPMIVYGEHLFIPTEFITSNKVAKEVKYERYLLD